MSDGLRRTALVTGASRGIGAEIARQLARAGFDLVLTSRHGDAGEQRVSADDPRHGVVVHRFAKDLGRPGAGLELWTVLERAGLEVDILVNNAGVGLYGPLATQPAEALTEMVELNVTSLTALTRLALPGMLRRGWGRILNVASVAAYQPGGPRMAAYYATKAYVLSFSMGLSRELAGTGVSVTALCPGPTRTSFEQGSGAAASILYGRLPAQSAEAVAAAGVRGMLRGARVVIPGLLSKAFAIAGGLPPRVVALEVNRFLLEKA